MSKLIHAETQMKIALLDWYNAVIGSPSQCPEEEIMRIRIGQYKKAVDDAVAIKFKIK